MRGKGAEGVRRMSDTYELALIPKSLTCPRCQKRIDVAKGWDAVQCPCGKVLQRKAAAK